MLVKVTILIVGLSKVLASSSFQSMSFPYAGLGGLTTRMEFFIRLTQILFSLHSYGIITESGT